MRSSTSNNQIRQQAQTAATKVSEYIRIGYSAVVRTYPSILETLALEYAQLRRKTPEFTAEQLVQMNSDVNLQEYTQLLARINELKQLERNRLNSQNHMDGYAVERFQVMAYDFFDKRELKAQVRDNEQLRLVVIDLMRGLIRLQEAQMHQEKKGLFSWSESKNEQVSADEIFQKCRGNVWFNALQLSKAILDNYGFGVRPRVESQPVSYYPTLAMLKANELTHRKVRELADVLNKAAENVTAASSLSENALNTSLVRLRALINGPDESRAFSELQSAIGILVGCASFVYSTVLLLTASSTLLPVLGMLASTVLVASMFEYMRGIKEIDNTTRLTQAMTSFSAFMKKPGQPEAQLAELEQGSENSNSI